MNLKHAGLTNKIMRKWLKRREPKDDDIFVEDTSRLGLEDIFFVLSLGLGGISLAVLLVFVEYSYRIFLERYLIKI